MEKRGSVLKLAGEGFVLRPWQAADETKRRMRATGLKTWVGDFARDLAGMEKVKQSGGNALLLVKCERGR